jgi:hypothetical protein
MLVIDLESLIINNSVTGTIYWDMNLFKFPDPKWNDNVVIVLSWWLQGLNDLLNYKKNVVEFLFMDGPYSLKVYYQDSESFVILFIHNGEVIRKKNKIYISDIIPQILATSNNLIRTLYKDCYDDDFSNLQSQYKSLVKSYQKWKNDFNIVN